MSSPTTDSAETLAEALFAACCKVGPTVDTKDLAAELIASDWMKRHDAEVRAPFRTLLGRWEDFALDPGSIEEEMRDELCAALAEEGGR